MLGKCTDGGEQVIQTQINQHLIEWDKTTRAFKAAYVKAGEDKAQWEHERAQLMRRLMHGEERLSKAAAEVEADANDHIYELRLEAVRTGAESEALKKRLDWCRSTADALRSEKVDEREANRLYSENPAGA